MLRGETVYEGWRAWGPGGSQGECWPLMRVEGAALACGRRNARLFPLLLEGRFDLGEGEAVHYVSFGQPAFASDVGSEAEVLELRDVMGIRVDDAAHAFSFRERPEAPVHVEAPPVPVEFNPGTGSRSGVDDAWDVEGVGFAGEQEATGEVAKHGHVRVFDGANDAFGHCGLAHFEGVVDGGDDVVELGEDFVGVIERSVFEDVAFDAREDAEVGTEFGVELVDSADLFEQLGFGKAACLDGAAGVIGNSEVLEAVVEGGVDHFA